LGPGAEFAKRPGIPAAHTRSIEINFFIIEILGRDVYKGTKNYDF
jgi:hypothetical protein